MAAPAEEACSPYDAAADVKPAAPHDAPDALSLDERRNLALLCAAWACSFSILAASVAALSVAAKGMSPSRKLDTVPVALILFATAVWNVPVAVALARFGRRRTFVACALIGAGGGAIAAGAIARRSFGGLCAAALALAVGNAAAQQYRFTAAELVPAERKPMAISAVLSGGIVGAVVGPEYAKRARLLLPRTPYAGVFVVAAGMGALNAALMSSVRFPDTPRVAAWPAPRELASPPARAVACAIAALAWYVMTFLMTPVPLAMLAQAREASFFACFLRS
jgi:MFS family permease